MKNTQLTGLILSLVAVLALPTESWATTCASGAQATTLLLNSTNTVPENVGGIPGTGSFNAVTVERLDGDENVEVEFSVVYSMIGDIQLIKPSDWAEGNSYRVVVTGEVPAIDQTVSVIPPFSLSGNPTLSVVYEPDAADPALELLVGVVTMEGLAVISDPELSPYLAFETLVDGVPWSSGEYCAVGPRPGLSAWGLGVERLPGLCSEGADSISAGGGYFDSGSVLDVAMSVKIIGDDVSLKTTPIVVDLDFECAQQITDEPTTERPAANDDGADGGCSSASGVTGIWTAFGLFGIFGFIRRRNR